MYMLTAQYIKRFGQYEGFSEMYKGYLYIVGGKQYIWNNQGIARIN